MTLKIAVEPADPAGEDELRRLVARAEGGDQAVLPELRQLLDSNPEIWRRYGDLAHLAEEALITLAAGPNLLLRESLTRKLAELKAELGLERADPLERLLIERAAACWLWLAYSDAAYSQVGGAPRPQADHARRRQDSAQRRYLEALKQLATVRRLLPPKGSAKCPQPIRRAVGQ